MKRIITIALVSLVGFMAAETTASAQLLKNLFKKATTETAAPTATTNGQAAGAALKSLYTQYKADGKQGSDQQVSFLQGFCYRTRCRFKQPHYKRQFKRCDERPQQSCEQC